MSIRYFNAIYQHGYIPALAPQDIKTTLNVMAQGYSGSTPCVRWGNWPFVEVWDF
jgi:apolipoprotein N-acyltransferase